MVTAARYHASTAAKGIHPSRKLTNAVSTRDNINNSRGSFDLIRRLLLSFNVVNDVCVAVAKIIQRPMPYALTDKHSSIRFPENFLHTFFSILFWLIPTEQTKTVSYSFFCSFCFVHPVISCQHTQKNDIDHICQYVWSGKQALSDKSG